MIKRGKPFLWALPLLVLFGQNASLLLAADAPQVINFQGRLTDSNNNPRTANLSFTFQFFDALAAGSALPAGSAWSETQTISVTNGVFNARIGSTTPIPYAIFANSTNVYLEITVAGETLSPRETLVAMPFAFNTKTLSGLTYDAFVDTSTAQIINGIKTFSTFPQKSGSGAALDPTLPAEFATKSYVDASAGGGPVIRLQETLQSGATFFVSSGAVAGQFLIGGPVGIGTSNPGALLDINGDGSTVLVPRKSTPGDPASGADGMIYYNASSKKFRGYQNGAWGDMITNPATGIILNQDTLQAGATFYVSSGTILNDLHVYGTINGDGSGINNLNPARLSAGNLPANVVASSITVNTVYPAAVSAGAYANITGLGAQAQALDMNNHLINNLLTPSSPSDAATKAYVDATTGSGAVILSTSTLQSGATFYTSSGTVNALTVGNSITLPAQSVALGALANGTLQSGVVASSIAANSVYPAAVSAGAYANITGLGAQAQALDMNNHLINNLLTPSSPSDAATKAYVDATTGSGAVILSTSILQSGATFYTSSGTVNALTVGNSITLPAQSVALAALANGTLQSGVVVSSIAANSVYPAAVSQAVYPNITGLGTQAQGLNMGSFRVTNSSTTAADAATTLATKGYVDAVAGSPANAIGNQSTLQVGATFYVSSGTVQNNLYVNGAIYGSGSGITNIPAASINAGSLGPTVMASSVAVGAIAGNYPGLTGVGTLVAGTWNASSIGSQYGGTGANLSGGQQGAVSYFSANGVMGASNVGSVGQVLQSNGAAMPSWVPLPSTGTLLSSTNTWTAPQAFASSISVSAPLGASVTYGLTAGSATITGNTLSINGVPYQWPASQGGPQTFPQNDGSGNITWVVPAAGGGGSNLVVMSGNVIVSSPTAFINFSTHTMLTSFVSGSTAAVTLNPSSVTLQGNTFNGAGQLVQLNGSGLVPTSLLPANLPGGSTSYVQISNSLQASSTFYISSGTVNSLTVGTSIGLPANSVPLASLAAGTNNNAMTLGGAVTLGGASNAVTISSNLVVSGAIVANNSVGSSGQILSSQGPGTTPTWINPATGSALLSSNNVWTAPQAFASSVTITAPLGLGVTYGAVVGSATVSDLSNSQFVKTDGSKHLISQSKIDLSADVTGSLPVASITGSNLPGGSTSYVQISNSLQANSTFYVSSGTVAGPFSAGSASGAVTISSNLIVNSGGSLGIGTNNLVAPLTVIGNANVSGTIYASAGNAYIDAANLGASSNAGTYKIGNFNASGSLGLNAGNAEWVRISSTGNVGISTGAPQSTLDVNGTADFGTTGKSTFTTTGALTMAPNASITLAGTGKVTGLAAPTAASDAATKSYVDTATNSITVPALSAANIPGGATSYVQIGNSLQASSTFYVSSGTVNNLIVGTSIGLPANSVALASLAAGTNNNAMTLGGAVTLGGAGNAVTVSSNLVVSGAIVANNSVGSSGQILSSQGPGTTPTWINPASANTLLSSTNTWTAGQTFVSSVTVSSNLVVNNGGNLSITGNTLSINGVPYQWPAAQGGPQTIAQNDGSGNITWVAPAGGGGSSNLVVMSGSVIVSSPTAFINFSSTTLLTSFVSGSTASVTLNPSSVTLQGNTFNGAGQLVQLNGSGFVPTSLLSANLPGGSTSYIQNTNTLQAGATAYPDFLYIGTSETVKGNLGVVGTINNASLAASSVVQTDGSKNLTTGLVNLGSQVTGSLPVANIAGSNLPGGSTSYVQISNSLQASSTFYVSSATINNFIVGTSIGLPANSVALGSLAAGTNNNAMTLGGALTLGGAGNAVTVSSNLVVAGAIVANNSVGSSGQILSSQGPGTTPTWINPATGSALLSTNNVWTAPQAFASSVTITAPLGLGVTYGAVVGSATISDLSNSQFVKTDGSKHLISQNKIDLSADVTGSLPVASITGSNLPGGSTSYVQISNSLQASSTFYISSGTVNSLTVGSSIGLPANSVALASLAAGTNNNAMTLGGALTLGGAGNAVTVSSNLVVAGAIVANNSVGSSGQILSSQGPGTTPTWINPATGSALLSSNNVWTAPQAFASSVTITAPLGLGVTYGAVVGSATINDLSNSQFVKTDGSKHLVSQNKIDLSADVTGSLPVANITGNNLPGGSTSYIQNTNTLQAGTTAYPDFMYVGTSETVKGNLGVTGTINNASLAASAVVQTDGSKNLTTGLVNLGSQVTGSLPVASLTGNNLPGGSTSYVQISNSLQASSTFYVSSATVNNLIVGTSIGLPANSVALAALAAGTNNNAMTLGGPLTLGGASNAVTISSNLVVSGAIVANNSVGSSGQILSSQGPGTTPTWINPATGSGLLSTNNVWTAPQAFASSVTITAPLGLGVTYGAVVGSATISDLSNSQFVKTDGSKHLISQSKIDLSADVTGSLPVASITGSNLPGGSTSYIQNANTLQAGTTAYPDFLYVGTSETVKGNLGVTGTINNASLAASAVVQTDGSKNLTTGLVNLGTQVTGSLPVANIAGSNLPGGSTSYVQIGNSLQAGSTFYISSGTINSLTVGSSIGLPANSVALTSLAAGTNNNAITLGGALTLGGAGNAVTISSNLVVAGAIVANNSVGSSGQILSSQGPGTTPTWINPATGSALLGTNNVWTAPQAFASSVTIAAPLGLGVTFGAVVGSATISDLSNSQFVKTDGAKHLISQSKIDLSADVTGSLPVASITGNNLPGGSTSYVQISNSLQASSTFYVSSATVTNFIVGTSIGLPANSVALASLAAGTNNNAMTLGGALTLGGAGNAVTVSSNLVVAGAIVANNSVGSVGQVLSSQGPGTTPTWLTPAAGGGSSNLVVMSGSVIVSSPTAFINFSSTTLLTSFVAGSTASVTLNPSSVTLQGNTFNGAGQLVQLTGSGLVPTSVLPANLPGGSTTYIQNTNTLQAGATAYPDFMYVGTSETVKGNLGVTGTINNASLAASAVVQTDGSKNLTTGLVNLGSQVTGSLPVANITGSNLPGGSTSYVQIGNSLQASSTFYVSSGTVNNFIVGTSIGLPANSVALGSLAAGTNNNAMTLGGPLTLGGAGNAVTISSNLVVAGAIVANNSVGSSGQILSSQGPGTTPTWINPATGSGLLSTNNVWTAPQAFASSVTITAPLGLGVTYGAVVGSATISDLSNSQFVKTDGSKHLISQNKIDLSADVTGSLPVASITGSNLPGGSTSYIQNTNTLQAGTTAYPDFMYVGTSETVKGNLGVTGTINNASLAASSVVQTDGSKNLTTGLVNLGSQVTGSLPVANIAGSNLPGGSTSYVQISNSLQASSTFYVSSATINNFIVGTSIGLPANSVALASLAAGTNNNALTLGGPLTLGGASNAVTISSNLVVAGAIVANNSVGSSGQILSSQGPGTTPTWINPATGSALLSTNNVWTAPQAFASSVTITAPLGLGVTYGAVLGSATISDLSTSQFVKTDGAKHLVSQSKIDLSADVTGSLPVASITGSNLPGGSTSYIQNTNALQAGTTAYPDFLYVGTSETVKGNLGVVGTINNASLAASSVVQTDGSKNLTTGLVNLGSQVTGSLPVSNITGSNLPGGSTSYVQISNSLQASSTFYVSSATINNFIVGTSIGLPANSVALASLAAGTNNNAMTLGGALTLGGAGNAVTISSNLVVAGAIMANNSVGSSGQILSSQGPGTTPTWINPATGSGLLSTNNVWTAPQAFASSVTITAPLGLGVTYGAVVGSATISDLSNSQFVKTDGSKHLISQSKIDLSADVTGSLPVASITGSNLPGGSTSYIQNTNTLQAGTTAYPDFLYVGTSETVKGNLGVTGTINNASLAASSVVQTDGSKNLTTGLVNLGSQVTGSLPVANIAGSNLPGGSTSYVQISNSLQASSTFYVSSGTVNNFIIGTSIGLPANSVALASLAAGTNNNAMTLGGALTLGGAGNAVTISSNLVVAGAIMANNSVGSSGQILSSQGPGTTPTWINPATGSGLLSTNNVWTAPQAFASSVTITAPLGLGVTFGAVVGSATISDLSTSQFVKTDGSKHLVSQSKIDLSADVTGSLPVASLTGNNLPGGSTSYIQNNNTLQAGATAYPDFMYVGTSETVKGNLGVTGTINNASLAASSVVQTDGSKNLTTGLVNLGSQVTGSLPVASLTGNNLPGGSTSYVQISNSLQASSTFYVSSATVNNFIVGTSIGLPANSVALASLAAGTNNNAMTLGGPLTLGGASNAVTISSNLVVAGAIVANNSVGSSGQILSSQGPGTTPTWINPATGSALLSTNNVWTAPQAFASSVTITAPLGLGVTYGAVVGSATISDLSNSQFVKTDGSKHLISQSKIDLSADVTGSLPVASITGSNLPGGSTSYIQNRNSLQAGTTAYPDFLYVGTSMTVLGAASLGAAGKAVTISSNAYLAANGGVVGIGTATPGNLVEVKTNDGVNDGLRVTSSGRVEYVLLKSNDGWTGKGGIGYATGLNFASNINPQVMYLDQSGNIGIGTWSPTSKLHMSSGTFTVDGGSGTINVTGGGGITSTYGVTAGSITVNTLSASQFVKTDGSKNLVSGGLQLSDIPGGSTSYIQVSNALQASSTFYVSSATVNNFTVGNSIVLPANSVALASLASGTNNNAITLGGALTLGGASNSVTISSNLVVAGAIVANNSTGSSGQILSSQGPGTTPTWINPATGSALLSTNNVWTAPQAFASSVTITAPLGLGVTYGAVVGSATISDLSNSQFVKTDGSKHLISQSKIDLSADVTGSLPVASITGSNLPGGSTSYIQNTNTLQAGTTAYPDFLYVGTSETVKGNLGVTGTINNASLAASSVVQTDGSKNLTTGLVNLGSQVTGSLPVANIAGSNLPGGSTSYIQISNSLQASSTFYVSSATINNFIVGTSIGLPANSVALASLAAGTNNNAITLGGALTLGGASNSVTISSNLVVAGAIVANNSTGSSGQILSSQGPGTTPTWINPATGSTLLSTNNVWTAPQAFASSVTITAPLGLGVTYGAVVGSATISDLSNSQFVKTDGSKHLISQSKIDLSADVTGSLPVASITGSNLPGGSTSYMRNSNTLQSGATDYPDFLYVGTSETVKGNLGVTGTINNASLAASAVVQTDGSKNLTTGLVNLGSQVTGSLPVANITGSNLPGGSTSYLQNTSTLQTGTTFYVSSGTVGGLTLTGSLTVGNGVGSGGQILQSNAGSAPTWVTASGASLSSTNTWTAQQNFNNQITVSSSILVTNGAVSVSSGTIGSSIYNNVNSCAIDWSTGNTQYVSLTSNCSITFANGLSGRKYVLILNYTGVFTPSWPASVRFPGGVTPTLTSVNGKTDYLAFMYNDFAGKYDNLAETLNY